MIRIRHNKVGRACPIIQCDRCGAELEDGKGLCYLRANNEIEFYCKQFVNPDCDPGRSGADDGWMDIGEFIVCLATNSKTDLKKAADRIKRMDM